MKPTAKWPSRSRTTRSGSFARRPSVVKSPSRSGTSKRRGKRFTAARWSPARPGKSFTITAASASAGKNTSARTHTTGRARTLAHFAFRAKKFPSPCAGTFGRKAGPQRCAAYTRTSSCGRCGAIFPRTNGIRPSNTSTRGRPPFAGSACCLSIPIARRPA